MRTKFVNLTNEGVQVRRVISSRKASTYFISRPFSEIEYNLPEPKKGVIFIVDYAVYNKYKDVRSDIVYIGQAYCPSKTVIFIIFRHHFFN